MDIITLASDQTKLLKFMYSNNDLRRAFDSYNFDYIYKWFDNNYTPIRTSFTNMLYTLNIDPLKYVSKVWYKMYDASSNIEDIVIPGNIKVIDDGAFRDCDQLKAVKIEEGLERIGWLAFKNCSSLKSISIPNSVTKIGDKCFMSDTSLVNVQIGTGIQYIGERAFGNCSKLTQITYLGTMMQFKSINLDTNWVIYRTIVHCMDGDLTYKN